MNLPQHNSTVLLLGNPGIDCLASGLDQQIPANSFLEACRKWLAKARRERWRVVHLCHKTGARSGTLPGCFVRKTEYVVRTSAELHFLLDRELRHFPRNLPKLRVCGAFAQSELLRITNRPFGTTWDVQICHGALQVIRGAAKLESKGA